MRDSTSDSFLRKSFSQEDYDKYISPISLHYEQASQILNVKFPHKFFQQLFFNNIRERFEKKISSLYDEHSLIRYSVVSYQSESHPQLTKVRQLSSPYGQHYTFDNFIYNHQNTFAFNICKYFIHNSSLNLSPLILIGSSGVGKSHLLKSIGNACAKEYGPSSSRLLSLSELFSIRKKGVEDPLLNSNLKMFLLHLGCWPFFELPESERYYLSSLIQSLILHNVHIACAMDCNDQVNNIIMPQFLHHKLVLNIHNPDIEVRTQYLKKVNRSKRLGLDKDQILNLALLNTNFIELSRVTSEIKSHKDFRNKESLNHDHGNSHLDSILKTNTRASAVSSQDILLTTAKQYNLLPEDLTGASRKSEVVRARSQAIFLCREFLGLSLPSLGRIFGGRDHASILYSLKKVQKLQETDPDMNKMLNEIRQNLRHGHQLASLTSPTQGT